MQLAPDPPILEISTVLILLMNISLAKACFSFMCLSSLCVCNLHPGVFIYPLGEKEVVVGFEAVIAGRLVGVQIQSRGKLKDCCLDCCPGVGLEGNGLEWGCCGSPSLDMQCTNGEGEDGRML